MGYEFVEISRSSSYSRRRRIQFYCGLDSPLATAWTSENPGRRFYGCGLFKLQGIKGCFFYWYNDKIPERSKEVVNSFLKKVNKLKKKDSLTKKSDDDMKKKNKLLILSWFFIIMLITKGFV
ncbi:unnamed protein product [Lathyrus sativus]|nr:unnamed protein product [Lathyrus sativus]